MTAGKGSYNQVLSGQSIYCYEGTDVYINSRDIKNKDTLEYVESMLSTYQLSKLNYSAKCNKKEQKIYKKATSNNFDVEQFISIHKFLFYELYPKFAGVFRYENISKGTTPFCRIEYISMVLEDLLKKLKIRIIQCKTIDEFLDVLSEYYGEINIVHPFREGNGRTQREFFRQFVECYSVILGFGELTLDYGIMNQIPELKKMFIDGSIAAVNGNYRILRLVFQRVLTQKQTLEIDGRGR